MGIPWAIILFRSTVEYSIQVVLVKCLELRVGCWNGQQLKGSCGQRRRRKLEAQHIVNYSIAGLPFCWYRRLHVFALMGFLRNSHIDPLWRVLSLLIIQNRPRRIFFKFYYTSIFIPSPSTPPTSQQNSNRTQPQSPQNQNQHRAIIAGSAAGFVVILFGGIFYHRRCKNKKFEFLDVLAAPAQKEHLRAILLTGEDMDDLGSRLWGWEFWDGAYTWVDRLVGQDRTGTCRIRL